MSHRPQLTDPSWYYSGVRLRAFKGPAQLYPNRASKGEYTYLNPRTGQYINVLGKKWVPWTSGVDMMHQNWLASQAPADELWESDYAQMNYPGTYNVIPAFTHRNNPNLEWIPVREGKWIMRSHLYHPPEPTRGLNAIILDENGRVVDVLQY